MKLSREEKEICKKYATPEGYMSDNCYECPLMITPTECKCKLNAKHWSRYDQMKVNRNIEKMAREQKYEKNDQHAFNIGR